MARAAIVAAVVLAGLLPRPVRAEPVWPDADTVRAVIVDRAAAHGVDPALLLCTDRRESRLDPAAVGRRGERGVAQWLPPAGGRNAWDETSAYRELGIDVFAEYRRGNPDAVWFDVDGQAELFARGRGPFHWASTYCAGAA